jgi:hypothetical protein
MLRLVKSISLLTPRWRADSLDRLKLAIKTSSGVGEDSMKASAFRVWAVAAFAMAIVLGAPKHAFAQG